MAQVNTIKVTDRNDTGREWLGQIVKSSNELHGEISGFDSDGEMLSAKSHYPEHQGVTQDSRYDQN